MLTAQEVRPSVGALIGWLGLRVRSGKLVIIQMVALIIGAASGTLAFGRGRTAVVLLIVAGGIALLWAGLCIIAIGYFLTTKLSLNGDRLELVSFGSRREWQRRDLARIVRCARISPMGFAPDRLGLLLDGSGKLLLTLPMAYWREADLQFVSDLLRIPVQGQWTDVSSYQDLARQFPAA